MSIQDRVREIITLAIKQEARKVYDDTQERCPVRSGFLKRSGSFFDTGNTVGLIYTAPYAELVNRGMKEGWHTFSSYMTSKGTRVSSYTAWQPAKPGKHFIDAPIASSKVLLSRIVLSELQRNFKVV
jgi:hypothetical protein